MAGSDLLRVLQEPFCHVYKDENESSFNVAVLELCSDVAAAGDVRLEAALCPWSADSERTGGESGAELTGGTGGTGGTDTAVPVQTFEVASVDSLSVHKEEYVVPREGGSRETFQYVHVRRHARNARLLLLHFRACRATPIGKIRDYSFRFRVWAGGAVVPAEVLTEPFTVKTKQKRVMKAMRQARAPAYYSFMSGVISVFEKGAPFAPIDRNLTFAIEHHSEVLAAPASSGSRSGSDSDTGSGSGGGEATAATRAAAGSTRPRKRTRRAAAAAATAAAAAAAAVAGASAATTEVGDAVLEEAGSQRSESGQDTDDEWRPDGQGPRRVRAKMQAAGRVATPATSAAAAAPPRAGAGAADAAATAPTAAQPDWAEDAGNETETGSAPQSPHTASNAQWPAPRRAAAQLWTRAEATAVTQSAADVQKMGYEISELLLGGSPAQQPLGGEVALIPGLLGQLDFEPLPCIPYK